MKRAYHRLLITAGLVAGGTATAALIHSRIAKSLMSLAVDREESPLFRRRRDQMMNSDSIRPLASRMRTAAATLMGAPHREIVIAAKDGTALVGHWFPCPQPQRIVIAMHGWRSSWAQDFGAIAPFLVQSHCHVLYAEQRGQGESGGDCMAFGLHERHDCCHWAAWAAKRCDGALPIYLWGVSMGGTTVLMATGDDLPAAVQGVIADCAFTSPTAIWEHVAQHTLHVPYSLYRRPTDAAFRRRTDTDARAYSVPQAMKSCRVPVLFVHGAADRLVPVDMTYESYLACAAPRQLLIVPGADHGMSYLTDPHRYEQTVTAFWNEIEKN